MSPIVLGVDGGNTKSHYALFDGEGRALGLLARGPLSHEALPGGYFALREELERGLKLLLGPLGLEPGDLGAAVLGLAGTDTADQHRRTSALLADLGLGRFRLVNDAFLGLKVGSPRGWGICSVNGTGTSTVAVAPDGRSLQVGGQGYFTGDEGGGGFLAERALRAVYDEHYRCGPSTALGGILVGALGLADADELFRAYAEGEAPALEISKSVFRAAREGDGVAIGILDAIGRNAGESTLGAARRIGFARGGELDIVMIGSLFVKADSGLIVESYERTVVEGLGDRLRFILLEAPPVAGAAIWALEDLLGEAPPGLRARVIEEVSAL